MNADDLSAFRDVIATPSLPELGPQPRPGVQSVSALTPILERFFKSRQLTTTQELALRSATFLWHDHLDASHEISQSLPDVTGSFLHGIMHRREPDYHNAKYWFRQTTSHPACPAIAQRVRELAGKDGETAATLADLTRREVWDPFAFVDLCAATASLPTTDPRYQVLQEVQAIEFHALLESV